MQRGDAMHPFIRRLSRFKEFFKCFTAGNVIVKKDDEEETNETVVARQLTTGSCTVQNPEPGIAPHSAEGTSQTVIPGQLTDGSSTAPNPELGILARFPQETSQTANSGKLNIGAKIAQTPELALLYQMVEGSEYVEEVDESSIRASSRLFFDNPGITSGLVSESRGEAQRATNINREELQEAFNIVDAAYREVMYLAFKAGTWVCSVMPEIGAAEEYQKTIRISPLPEMRVVNSVETEVLPISQDELISIMMDVDNWRSAFTHIVQLASVEELPCVLHSLGLADCTIHCTRMIKAELRLPVPFVPVRKLRFLRCQKLLTGEGWAIIDVPGHYFEQTSSASLSQQRYRRMPSGVIIRRHEQYSEVIWIENGVVYAGQHHDILFSTLLNAAQAFSAKHWITILSRHVKRRLGTFPIAVINLHPDVRTKMLNLINRMESEYLDCVSDEPHHSKWSCTFITTSRNSRTIFRRKLDSHLYLALTCFHLRVKPSAAFRFLLNKNVHLQWPSPIHLDYTEAAVRYVTEDDRDRITLHRHLVIPTSAGGLCQNFLEVASRDEYCSLIISSTVSQQDVDSHFGFKVPPKKITLRPSGFAVIPYGAGGLQSSACLVTVAFMRDIYVQSDRQANVVLDDRLNSILSHITKVAIDRGEGSSLMIY